MNSTNKYDADGNGIYFFTATIHSWLPLLDSRGNKEMVVAYLKELSERALIRVYAFVIMPNHVHIIWEQVNKNGKETAQGSFLKYTAHRLLKKLKETGDSGPYEVYAANKKHEIWQPDSLSIEIYSRAVAKQKLDYLHFNPVSGKWRLAADDLSYYYSSARFYETGIDEFGFLHDLYSVFDGE